MVKPMGALDTSLPQVELFDDVIQYGVKNQKRSSLKVRRTLEPLLFKEKEDDLASSEGLQMKKQKNQSFTGKSPFMEDRIREGYVNHHEKSINTA